MINLFRNSKLMLGNGTMRFLALITLFALPVSAHAITDDELLAKISDLSSKAKIKHLEIKTDSEGRLKVYGEPYIDPEGKIERFSKYSSNGLFSYLVETTEKSRAEGGRNYVIKVANPFNNKAIQIGTANIGRTGVTVFTATEEKVNGDSIHLVSDGFILIRKERSTDTVFIYEPGKGLSTLRFEPTRANPYHLYPWQTGDVFGTRKLMVYRNKSSMGGFLTTSSYSWFDMDTKKMVGEFDTSVSYKLLVSEDGYFGYGKDFARWLVTPSGRKIAVCYDDHLKDINLLDFETGKKYSILRSTLVMTGLDVTLDKYPKTTVKARPPLFAGYENVDVDDLLANQKEIEVKQEHVESSGGSE